MLGADESPVRVRHLRARRRRRNQLLLARLQIDAPDAGVVGARDVPVRVGEAGVAVAGPAVVQAAEIGATRPASVRAERVDRAGQRALLARLDVEDVADEAVVLAVVPDHLASSIRATHCSMQPCCQFQARLWPSSIQRSSSVQVDHADPDHVVRRAASGVRNPSRMPST